MGWVEYELERWKGFRKALTNEEDKEAFDELMDTCRQYGREVSLQALETI